MEKYEIPVMEISNYEDSIGTNDIIINSVIEKDDNNAEMIGPW